ncbi:MAG: tRNA (adenosine(37)-N6)-threonylcarbamoyltransferase complex ATPase subunit type 1 TsaE [Clostridia bacterium]|nr:tRNA (adenosine(37)-N6)-threonylcarbamoyltransferase complex ATPase subunit type 1 TsaE [Clostridia bacterium]
MKYVSNSESETQEIGKNFCKNLKAGDTVRLEGDPGAGKSVFVRGMAEELGVSEYITSPTFTLVNEYESGRIPLYHFDAYRLSGCDAADSGLDEYFCMDGICAVEWPENMEGVIPEGAYTVTIERNLDISDDYRSITIEKSKKV